MAAVALQRELDAYSDAINTYNRQARNYKAAATKHNESVDAYNASFVGGVDKQAIYKTSPTSGYFTLVQGEGPEKISRSKAAGPGGSAPANATPEYLVVPNGNYYSMRTGANINTPTPGNFTMAQPTQPGAAPSATAAQMRRLDAPSLIDIERTGSSGLISSAFNY